MGEYAAQKLLSLAERRCDTLQESLEQLTDAALQPRESPATAITAISLKPRLVFDSSDDVTLGVFTKTSDSVILHSDYLPTRSILVEWVRRSKAKHPRLQTFKLVLVYITCLGFNSDHSQKDKKLLEFEYRDANAGTESYGQPAIEEQLDLRAQQAEAKARQFRYTVFPDAAQACYDRLMAEAEMQWPDTANAQVAMTDDGSLVEVGVEGDAAGAGDVDGVA
jgi:hypothetical protein